MSAVLKSIREQLPALTLQEREELLQELLVLVDGPDEPEEGYAEAWTAEIDRRIAEIDAGTAKLVTREEFSRHMRKVLGQD